MREFKRNLDFVAGRGSRANVREYPRWLITETRRVRFVLSCPARLLVLG